MEETDMKCPQCKYPIEKKQRFCEKCGCDLKQLKKKRRKMLIPAGIGMGVAAAFFTVAVCLPEVRASAALQKKLDMGAKYLASAEYDKAQIAFEEALEIDEKSPEATVGLIHTYNGQKRPDKSLKLLEDTVSDFERSTEKAKGNRKKEVRNARIQQYMLAFQDTEKAFKEQGDQKQADEVKQKQAAYEVKLDEEMNIVINWEEKETEEIVETAEGNGLLGEAKQETDSLEMNDEETEEEGEAKEEADSNSPALGAGDSHAQEGEGDEKEEDMPEPDGDESIEKHENAKDEEKTEEDGEIKKDEKTEVGTINTDGLIDQSKQDDESADKKERNDEGETAVSGNGAEAEKGGTEETEEIEQEVAKLEIKEEMILETYASEELTKSVPKAMSKEIPVKAGAEAEMSGLMKTEMIQVKDRKMLLAVKMEGGRILGEVYGVKEGKAAELSSFQLNGETVKADGKQPLFHSQECFFLNQGETPEIGLVSQYSGPMGADEKIGTKVEWAVYQIKEDGKAELKYQAALTNGKDFSANKEADGDTAGAKFKALLVQAGMSGTWVDGYISEIEKSDLSVMEDLSSVPNPLKEKFSSSETKVKDIASCRLSFSAGSESVKMEIQEFK